ncbi:MAG: nitronate monooxygenase [Caulobacteraceae bacterium]|nr:nitronate monooxygenase [Caulobacteraceae bacterium]
MTVALDPAIRSCLTLPAVCAPMYRISTPALVTEACKAGLIGAIPRQNVRDIETFDAWLGEIKGGLDAHRAEHPDARIGPIAANVRISDDEEGRAHAAICKKYGIELIITAMGDPTEMAKRIHDFGGKIFHDVTNIRFAEKAIAAGVDGVTCIGSGGGGHSGLINHLAFVPKVRTLFDGVIIMAGGISTGAAIRAAEMLGADLAYLGTRFIATQESKAADEYKALLVSQGAADLIFTHKVAGGAAMWMKESLRMVGLDPDNLPEPGPKGGHAHLPEGLKPWFNIWSAGQGIELITDIPTVAELVRRLREEYIAACAIPDFAEAARLANRALETASA